MGAAASSRRQQSASRHGARHRVPSAPSVSVLSRPHSPRSPADSDRPLTAVVLHDEPHRRHSGRAGSDAGSCTATTPSHGHRRRASASSDGIRLPQELRIKAVILDTQGRATEIRIVEVSVQTALSGLRATLAGLFAPRTVSAADVRVQYNDAEGDLVTVGSDAELRTLFTRHRRASPRALRLVVSSTRDYTASQLLDQHSTLQSSTLGLSPIVPQCHSGLRNAAASQCAQHHGGAQPPPRPADGVSDPGLVPPEGSPWSPHEPVEGPPSDPGDLSQLVDQMVSAVCGSPRDVLVSPPPTVSPQSTPARVPGRRIITTSSTDPSSGTIEPLHYPQHTPSPVLDGARRGGLQLAARVSDRGPATRPRGVQHVNSRAVLSSELTRHIRETPAIQWRRGKTLGSGAYGRVFLAMNASTGDMMAVKQVEFDPRKGGEELLLSLEREVSVLKSLDHPRIVRYLGIAVEEGADGSAEKLDIFLEYVPGGSIAQVLSQFGPLEEEVVRKYTRQVLEGLDYLHRNEIIHRDVKGANALVSDRGEVKLSDFGASKFLSNITSASGGICANSRPQGTVMWMAPEAIAHGATSPASDVWSLGCTVVEMCTGRSPWPYTNEVTAMFQIGSAKEPPSVPPHISPEGHAFLQLCFRLQAQQRPSCGELLSHIFVRNPNTPPEAARAADTPAENPGAADEPAPAAAPGAPAEPPLLPPLDRGDAHGAELGGGAERKSFHDFRRLRPSSAPVSGLDAARASGGAGRVMRIGHAAALFVPDYVEERLRQLGPRKS